MKIFPRELYSTFGKSGPVANKAAMVTVERSPVKTHRMKTDVRLFSRSFLLRTASPLVAMADDKQTLNLLLLNFLLLFIFQFSGRSLLKEEIEGVSSS